MTDDGPPPGGEEPRPPDHDHPDPDLAEPGAPRGADGTTDRPEGGDDATPRGADGTTDRPEGGDDGTGAGAVDDPGAYTTDDRTLDPRVRWLWILRGLVIAAVLGGATTGIALAVEALPLAAGAAVGVVIALLNVTHALLLYRSWSYRVRDDSLYLDRGVVTRVRTVVPYVRVQHIDTSRGPVERAVGLSSLVVYTAGSRGADVTVPGLTPEEASDLQTRLKALAIESEGEDAV